MIVRDEAAALPKALASIHGAPEVIICDTGSRDETREIAKAHGARVVDFSWCDDFSAARAFAESQASYDWIMRLDADERVMPCSPRLLSAEYADRGYKFYEGSLVEAVCAILRETKSDVVSQMFVRRCHSPGNDHWFPRLHRRSCFKWVYPVHELIKPRVGHRPICEALDGFVMAHDRDARPRPYRAILEEAIHAHPGDPYLAFHLGQACWEESDWAGTIKTLDHYQSLNGGYRFHRGEALRMNGEAWENLGVTDRALAAYVDSSRVEGRAEPLWQAACLALRLGDVEKAMKWVVEGAALAKSPPREMQPFGGLDFPYLLDWRRYDLNSWCNLREQILGKEP